MSSSCLFPVNRIPRASNKQGTYPFVRLLDSTSFNSLPSSPMIRAGDTNDVDPNLPPSPRSRQRPCIAAQDKNASTHSISATSGPSSANPRLTLVTLSRGAHTFTPTLTWYLPIPATSSSPSALSVIANGPACTNRYPIARLGYAALAYVGSPCSSTSSVASSPASSSDTRGVVIVVGGEAIVRSSGTRSRRELGRRVGEMERMESAEPGRTPVGDSSERRDATDPERERPTPKGSELRNAAGIVKLLGLVACGVGVTFLFSRIWTPLGPGGGGARVAVRVSGASAFASESGRVPLVWPRPSRISRARLRSPAVTSTDALVSSLSDEDEESWLDDVGDVTGDVVGVDDSLEWRKSEVRRMSLDLRLLLRNQERRFFLSLVSGPGSSIASGALGDDRCPEVGGAVDLRCTSRDFLLSSWAKCWDTASILLNWRREDVM